MPSPQALHFTSEHSSDIVYRATNFCSLFFTAIKSNRYKTVRWPKEATLASKGLHHQQDSMAFAVNRNTNNVSSSEKVDEVANQGELNALRRLLFGT